MDIRITRMNGETFTLAQRGITVKDFNVSSVEIENEFETVDGRDGFVDMGASYGGRTITAPFYFKAADLLDYPLLRDDLSRIVSSKEPFYISELRRPSSVMTACNGAEDYHEESEKRYLVRSAGAYNVEQTFRIGEGELTFVTVGLPYAESVGTTLDPLTFTAEKWQVGQGLTLEEPKYAHSTATFRIFNAGDVAVDPRQMPLKIVYRGASSGLAIRNNTTGDVWAYGGTSGTSDQLTLDGVRSLKNGASVFKDTNKRLITIAPGWNDFTLTGATGSFLISFEHRFYYL